MKRKALLTTLFNLQGGKCFYCEGGMDLRKCNTPSAATVDHLVAKSKGGAKDIYNAVAACRDCNQAKSNAPFIIFYLHVKGKSNVQKDHTPCV